MVVFALMALIPGGLVYAISFQFLQRSIESWFDVRVDESLKRGLKLAQQRAARTRCKELAHKAEIDGAVRSPPRRRSEAATLNRLREQHSIEEATLLTPRGKVIAQSGVRARDAAAGPARARTCCARCARSRRVRTIEEIPERGLYLRVIVPVNVLTIADDIRILQVLQRVPPSIARDAQLVAAGLQATTRSCCSRASGLKRIFGLTLTLAMLLTLFSALALAFVLSEKLSAPLSALAEATRAIAKGDYSKLNPVKSRDEFGVLTQSFNTMTRQIADATEAMERNQQQLENAKTYLESILSNLTSGVLTFDERLYVKTMNAAANQILAVPAGAFHGLKLPEWPRHVQAVAPFAEIALRHFASSSMRQWEEQMEYRRADGPRTLLLRGTRLGQRGENGYVVVFDDITHLIQAQRDAAWGEVARRLAHEIKNPLTPIQLSAERLQHKLHDKLPRDRGRDAQARDRHDREPRRGAEGHGRRLHAVRARLAHERAGRCTLNELVREVLVLYEVDGRGDRAAPGRERCRRSTPIRRCCARCCTTSSRTRSTRSRASRIPRILVSTSLGTGGRASHGARQRHRHRRGRDGPHLRAVRHHQAQGNRASASRS